MSAPLEVPRRTQAERREATIQKLIDATVATLVERGYSGTSVGAICKHAGLSQGGLFRHFGTRLDLVAACADEIGRRHIARFESDFGQLLHDGPATGSALVPVVRKLRELTRSNEHAAWREVMVAARTDPELRARVVGPMQHMEAVVLDMLKRWTGARGRQAEQLWVTTLSIMHLFDSEAMTVSVVSSPAIEEARIDWAAEVLGAALAHVGR